MRFVLGFASGFAAAWVALAIWQRVPPIGPVDPGDDEVWEPRRGDRRPGFDESVAREHGLYEHAEGCRYPARPCACGTFVDMHGGFYSP